MRPHTKEAYGPDHVTVHGPMGPDHMKRGKYTRGGGKNAPLVCGHTLIFLLTSDKSDIFA